MMTIKSCPPDLLSSITRRLEYDNLIDLIYLSGDKDFLTLCLQHGGVSELLVTSLKSCNLVTAPHGYFPVFRKLRRFELKTNKSPNTFLTHYAQDWTVKIQSPFMEEIIIDSPQSISLFARPWDETKDLDYSHYIRVQMSVESLKDRFPCLRLLHCRGSWSEDCWWHAGAKQYFLSNLPPSLTSLQLPDGLFGKKQANITTPSVPEHILKNLSHLRFLGNGDVCLDTLFGPVPDPQKEVDPSPSGSPLPGPSDDQQVLKTPFLKSLGMSFKPNPRMPHLERFEHLESLALSCDILTGVLYGTGDENMPWLKLPPNLTELFYRQPSTPMRIESLVIPLLKRLPSTLRNLSLTLIAGRGTLSLSGARLPPSLTSLLVKGQRTIELADVNSFTQLKYLDLDGVEEVVCLAWDEADGAPMPALQKVVLPDSAWTTLSSTLSRQGSKFIWPSTLTHLNLRHEHLVSEARLKQLPPCLRRLKGIIILTAKFLREDDPANPGSLPTSWTLDLAKRLIKKLYLPQIAKTEELELEVSVVPSKSFVRALPLATHLTSFAGPFEHKDTPFEFASIACMPPSITAITEVEFGLPLSASFLPPLLTALDARRFTWAFDPSQCRDDTMERDCGETLDDDEAEQAQINQAAENGDVTALPLASTFCLPLGLKSLKISHPVNYDYGYGESTNTKSSCLGILAYFTNLETLVINDCRDNYYFSVAGLPPSLTDLTIDLARTLHLQGPWPKKLIHLRAPHFSADYSTLKPILPQLKTLILDELYVLSDLLSDEQLSRVANHPLLCWESIDTRTMRSLLPSGLKLSSEMTCEVEWTKESFKRLPKDQTVAVIQEIYPDDHLDQDMTLGESFPPNLKHLLVANNSMWHAACAAAIPRSLTDLAITGEGWPAETYRHLPPGLTHLYLNLGGILTPAILQVLPKAIRYLELAEVAFQPGVFSTFEKEIPSLTRLTIWQRAVVPPAAEFAQLPSSLRHLIISLPKNKIDTFYRDQFAKLVLPNFPTLAVLFVN